MTEKRSKKESRDPRTDRGSSSAVDGGVVLATKGVEPVKDPRTGKKVRPGKRGRFVVPWAIVEKE